MTERDPLYGVHLKLDRAGQQLNGLRANNKIFADRGPITVRLRVKPYMDEASFEFAVREQPPADLGVLVGELLHNLRSALDQLVWQLVLANKEEPVPKNAFPIATSETSYPNYSKGLLKGLSETAIRDIAAFRPYKDGNPALWRLHWLNSEDKHHTLLVGGAKVRRMIFGMRVLPTGPYTGFELPTPETSAENYGFPIKDGDTLLTSGTYELQNFWAPPLVAWETAFGSREYRGHEPVTIGELQETKDHVVAIVESLERGHFH